ncbi:MAG: hypothetical protein N2C14_05490 [Planctomycetales bacterium]
MHFAIHYEPHNNHYLKLTKPLRERLKLFDGTPYGVKKIRIVLSATARESSLAEEREGRFVAVNPCLLVPGETSFVDPVLLIAEGVRESVKQLPIAEVVRATILEAVDNWEADTRNQRAQSVVGRIASMVEVEGDSWDWLLGLRDFLTEYVGSTDLTAYSIFSSHETICIANKESDWPHEFLVTIEGRSATRVEIAFRRCEQQLHTIREKNEIVIADLKEAKSHLDDFLRRLSSTQPDRQET